MVRTADRVPVNPGTTWSRHRSCSFIAGVLIACVVATAAPPEWVRAADGDADFAAKSAGDTPAKQVRGRVVMQSDGKPVPDADVRLVTWTDGHRHYDLKKTRSDREGEFTFKDVKPGEHRLAAFFGDFASRKSLYAGEPVDLKSEQSVVLTLSKMPSISVHVTSKADGKPIEGAVVRFIWTDTRHDNPTDDKGNVVLRALTHQVWNVRVFAKGFAELSQDVNLNNTETANITFELEPGGILFGTIKDDAGRLLNDAGVSISPADHQGSEFEYMRSAADGRYRFEHVPLNQRLELSSSKDDYLRDERQISLSGEFDVKREINLVLKRRPYGGAVRGTVTDAEGKPIAGATIGNEGGQSNDIRSAKTDESGHFLLDDVYEGSMGHELFVKAKGFAPQQLKFRPGTKEKPGEIKITLQRGHRIRGRVVDEAGKAIAGVGIFYANAQHSPGMAFGGRGQTDSEGRFEFDSLPDDCPFSFKAAGYSEIEDDKLPLDGDNEVVVTMLSEGIIKGRVVDATSGKPISTFNVQLTFSPDRKNNDPGHGLGGARATTPTGEKFANSDGAFVLKELIRGMPLQVTVQADGYERRVERRILAEGDSDVKVVEFRLATVEPAKLFIVRGRIVDQQSQPITGAELRLISAKEARSKPSRLESFVEYPFGWEMIQSGQTISVAGVNQMLQTTSGADGTFTFKDVRPAAAMEIAYWGEGISQGRLDSIEQLSADEREKLTIKTVTPGTVRGKIDRKAMPDVTDVSLSSTSFDIDMDSRYANLSASDSTYEFRNVPPGKYQLEVDGERVRNGRTNGFTPKILQRHAVEIRTGETFTLDIGVAK